MFPLDDPPNAAPKSASLPIYRLQEDHTLELWHSAVMLKFEGQVYFVTAAHGPPDENGEHRTFVGGIRNPIPLPRTMFRSALDAGCTVKNDTFDLAALKLNPDEVQSFGGVCEIFPLRLLEFDTGEYILSGFPCVRNLGRGKHVSPLCFILPLEGDYKPLAHDRLRKGKPDFWLSLVLNKEKVLRGNGALRGITSFQGMSGGAILARSVLQPDAFTEFAGIVLEGSPMHNGRKFHFVGLKAGAILCWIRQHREILNA